MRTTLTIADDVARELERRRRATGRSLKAEVDHLLRLGLLADERRSPQRRRTPTLELGPSLAGPLDDVSGVLAALDERP